MDDIDGEKTYEENYIEEIRIKMSQIYLSNDGMYGVAGMGYPFALEEKDAGQPATIMEDDNGITQNCFSRFKQ